LPLPADEVWLVIHDDSGAPLVSRAVYDTSITLYGLPMDGRALSAMLHTRVGMDWADTSVAYVMSQP
jgi:hypothetical protein